MTKRRRKRDDLEQRARVLPGSPLRNLLLEDATAAKQHGRVTARVGVLEDGNPIVYSTDDSTGDAVVAAIQQATNVRRMRIPEVNEADFAALMRGVGVPVRALVPASEVDGESAPEPAVQATDDAPFVLRVRVGARVVREVGPFERITDAIGAMHGDGARGHVATVYDGSRVADYRGGRAVFRFGRTRWSRDDD